MNETEKHVLILLGIGYFLGFCAGVTLMYSIYVVKP